jgi:hypothetical protein
MVVNKIRMLIVPTLAISCVLAQFVYAQSSGDKLEITAFAVNMSNIGTGSNAVVDITVNSWSTPDERQRLITTMLTKGSDALLRELQKTPVKGRFRIPGAPARDPAHLALGLDLHYAWQTPLPEGGRRIVLATDRYIGIREATNRPRSIDYPFTLIEIRTNKDGEGEGKMSVATKISFDKEKNVIELENYASEPVRLNNVRVKTKT